jgi:hypothetical protein
VAKLTAIKGPLRRRRPRVGTVTSDAVRWAADAFAPLTDDELKHWGI